MVGYTMNRAIDKRECRNEAEKRRRRVSTCTAQQQNTKMAYPKLPATDSNKVKASGYAI